MRVFLCALDGRKFGFVVDQSVSICDHVTRYVMLSFFLSAHINNLGSVLEERVNHGIALSSEKSRG
jgi:hypothetical protein